MNPKKYLAISLLPTIILGIYYLIDVVQLSLNPKPMQYGYSPTDFMVMNEKLVMISCAISITFSIITIRKGNKWGWLALFLPLLIIAFGGLIYLVLSI